MINIQVQYPSSDYPRLEKIKQGNWIDISLDSVDKHLTDKDIVTLHNQDDWKYLDYKKGDVLLLNFGIAMALPNGYEAYVAPRSSTFKKTGLILTNGIGVIDTAYRGTKDLWRGMVYATRDGRIKKHDKLFQFRIQETQPEIQFVEVDRLDGQNRGGFGSTDKKLG